MLTARSQTQFRTLTAALSLMSVLWLAPVTGSERVTGTGTAVIADGNVEAARRAAITSALEDAVRKVVGILIKSESKVEDAQAAGKRIVAKSEGYVRKHRILEEKRVGDALIVVVEADVDESKVRHDFSDRVARFVEKNLVGPCNIMLSATSVNEKRHALPQYMCSVNDPTIATDSIEFQMPGGKWVKPAIYAHGTVIFARLDGAVARLSYVGALLRGSEARVKLIHPGTGKTVERPLPFLGFIYAHVQVGTRSFRKAEPTPFAKLTAEEKRTLLELLGEFSD